MDTFTKVTLKKCMYLLHCIQKSTPNGIKDVNLRPITVKLLEENEDKKPHDAGVGNDFSGCHWV